MIIRRLLRQKSFSQAGLALVATLFFAPALQAAVQLPPANAQFGDITILSWSLLALLLVTIALIFTALRWRQTAIQLEASRQAMQVETNVREQTDEIVRKLMQAVEQSPTSIVITDLQGRIEYVNRYFEEKTGYSATEALGRNPNILQSGKTPKILYEKMWETLVRGDTWRGEIINRRKNGEEYIEQATIAPVRDTDGSITHYVGIKKDITEQRQSERRIQRMAFFDELTETYNRTFLLQELKQRLKKNSRRAFPCALMLVNIDRFKRINEARDHTLGDDVLRTFSQRLRRLLANKSHRLARTGADEFAILMFPANEAGAAEQEARNNANWLAERIQADTKQAMLIKNEVFTITLSIGITLITQQDASLCSAVLRRAESALHRAKKQGGNQTTLFESKMIEAEKQFFAIERDLRHAIPNGQLRLYLQTLCDYNGEAVGAEALVRWQHPQKGLIAPGAFIPVAEESDLIVDLGVWVMTEACRLAVQEDMSGHPLHISVNISPRHFRRYDFVPWIKELLSQTGADPTHLTMEITENLLVENINEVIVKMNELATLGIHFSIDDFGTGYSSLTYLKRLPIHELKIDRSFVRDIPNDPSDTALAETIVAVASHMNLRVVAEGVETEEQARFMSKWPAVLQQGYYYAHPQPASNWITEWRKKHGLPPPQAAGAF